MLHRLGGLLSAPERDSVSGSMETLRQHLCSVHKPPWLGKVLEIRELPHLSESFAIMPRVHRLVWVCLCLPESEACSRALF